jgi:hypothetical protein
MTFTASDIILGETVLDKFGSVFEIIDDDGNRDVMEGGAAEDDRLHVVPTGGGFTRKRPLAEILKYAVAIGDEAVEKQTSEGWRWTRAGSEWYEGFTIRVAVNGPGNGFHCWNGWANPSVDKRGMIELFHKNCEVGDNDCTLTVKDGRYLMDIYRGEDEYERYTFDTQDGTLTYTWRDGDETDSHTVGSHKVMIGGVEQELWDVPGSCNWCWSVDEPSYCEGDHEPGPVVLVEDYGEPQYGDMGSDRRCYLIRWVANATNAEVVPVDAWCLGAAFTFDSWMDMSKKVENLSTLVDASTVRWE